MIKMAVTKKKKKAGIQLQFLLGIIIGLLLLTGTFYIAAKVYHSLTEEENTPLIKVKEHLEKMASANPYDSEEFTLMLKKDTALIGLNPKSTRVGLMNDGDFHYEMNPKVYDYLTTNFAKELFGETTASLIHFPRPTVCDENKACICYCEHPFLEDLNEDYFSNKKNLNEEDKEYYYKRYGSFKALGIIDLKTKLIAKELACSKLECANLDNVYFEPEMRNEFYNQYARDYDQDTWDKVYHATIDGRGVIRQSLLFVADLTVPYAILVHILDSIYNVYFAGSGNNKYPVPDFLYTNGFAIYRAENSYKGMTTLGYPNVLSSAIVVTIGKLINNNIAVCLNPKCVPILSLSYSADAEKNKILDELSGKSQLRKLEKCKNPPDNDRFKTKEGTNIKLIRRIVKEITTKGKTNTIIKIKELSPLRNNGEEGVYSNQAIRIVQKGTTISAELIAYCDDTKKTYQILKTEETEVPENYYKQCPKMIDKIYDPGDKIIMVRSEYSNNGEAIPCIKTT